MREILEAARANIEAGWCQGAIAREASSGNRLGEPCHPLDDKAVAWDILGAVEKALGCSKRKKNFRSVISRLEAIGGQGVISFNEAPLRTKEDVLALFDKALHR